MSVAIRRGMGTRRPVVADAAVGFDVEEAARAGLDTRLDHIRLRAELWFLLESCRFATLESAAEALCRHALLPPRTGARRTRFQAITLRLLGAARELEVRCSAGEFTYAREQTAFGVVDVVFEDDHVGVYRLRIRPGGSIPTHEHRVTDECELILDDGLLLQGRPISRGTAVRWDRRVPHRYDNPCDCEQAILCVDRPAFQPSDEVAVEVPFADLPPIAGVSYY